MGELRHWSPGARGGFEFLGGQFEVDEPGDKPEYEYAMSAQSPGSGWEEVSLDQIPERGTIRTHGMSFI